MKTKRFKNAIIALLFCLGFTGISNAQRRQPQQKEPPTFAQLLEKMDKNEDGKLSKAELKGPLKENFEKVDADEDGFITEAEFKKAPKPKGRKQKSS